MKKQFKTIFHAVVLLMFSGAFAFGQLTTINYYSNADTYVDSRFSGTPYGGSSIMKVGTHVFRGNQFYRRAFVSFNFSMLPANAVIYSAKIKITHNGTVYGSNPWKAKLVKSSWTESTVTASNQPSISTLPSDHSSSYTTSGNVVSIDVTSMAQRMVYGQIPNYGWSIQVNNESFYGLTGTDFYTKEHWNSSLRPKLEIKYYFPLKVSAAQVDHESGPSVANGRIIPTITGGASSSYTYAWEDASGTVVGTGANLVGISYGWYGLHMTGSYGEELYQGFLVGQDCAEVDIALNSEPNYTSNAYMIDQIVGNIDYGDYNYGNYNQFRTDNWTGSPWFDTKSLLKFHLWVDNALDVTQADLTLQGLSHYNVSTTNEADVVKVTEDWNETLVSFNNSPNVSSSISETIPNTTVYNQDAVVDMIDFWDTWKQNNTTNHGVQLQLQLFDDNYNTRQLYHSPNASSSANRPTIDFKVAMLHENDPLYCNPGLLPHNRMKRDLDAGYAITMDKLLRFSFEGEYTISAGEYLELNLYDMNHSIVASCDKAGVTTGGMTAFTYGADDNRFTLDLAPITGASLNNYYLLELITTKGDKRYLKFLLK